MGRDGRNHPAGICGRTIARLALTEEEIKAIKVPISIIVGDEDRLIQKLYVEPLQAVRKDWPVVEIKGANHLSCVAKPEFREEIAKRLGSAHGGARD